MIQKRLLHLYGEPGPVKDKLFSRLKASMGIWLMVVIFSGHHYFYDNSASAQGQSYLLDMNLDRVHYNYGDTVLVSGVLDDGDGSEAYRYAGSSVSMHHYNEKGELVEAAKAKIFPNGSYSHSFEAKKTLRYHGDGYQRILGSFEEAGHRLYGEVKFRVLPLPENELPFIELPKRLAEIVINGKVYRMLYQTPDNLSISIESQIGAIKVDFLNTSEKFAILELPRALIDARRNGTDTDFIVFSEEGKMVPSLQIDNQLHARTLLLNYTHGTELDTTRFFIIGTEITGREIQLPPIILKSEKDNYISGENAVLSGSISVRANPLPISIEIIDGGSNKTLSSEVITSDYFGNFSSTIKIRDALGAEGNYTVRVGHLNRMTVSQFSVTAGSDDMELPKEPSALQPVLVAGPSADVPVKTGNKVLITATVGHNKTESAVDLQFTAIIEVRDKITGITQFISIKSGRMPATDSEKQLEVTWLPEYAGQFELRVFTITEDRDKPFSKVVSSELQVY
jgi:hypothetical protein